jgi:hypothetical protein
MSRSAAAAASRGSPPHDEKQPTGSCEIAVVDAEGNWCQFMDTLQGSGIPGQVVGGVPMVGSHATFGHLQSSMDSTLVKGAKLRCGHRQHTRSQGRQAGVLGRQRPATSIARCRRC